MQAINGTLPEGVANPIGTLVYNVLGVVIFVGIAWICWARYEKRTKHLKINNKQGGFLP